MATRSADRVKHRLPCVRCCDMESNSAPVANAQKHRVLVIDDDDGDFLMFLRRKDQQELNVELQRARNAHEAFAMLRQQHADGRDNNMMILLDLNMPSMNGIEFLEELRVDPDLRDSIVVAVSGSSDPSDVRAAYSHHVAAYVVKTPDSTAKLIHLIKAYFDTVTMPSQAN